MRSQRPIRRGASVISIIILSVLCLGFAVGQTDRPERKVEGNVITSQHDPKVRIELPKNVQYAGADRWILYDVADCEVHAFVEADRDKKVHRLYWVQFEGYIPSKPDLTHTYDSPRHVNLGGGDFYVDTWVRAKNESVRPGSDREHVEALIRGKGFTTPDGMMYVRLVHLLDEKKRKELMIIYGEDVAPTGFTAPDLQKDGKAFDRWPAIDKGLIERAQENVALNF